MTIRWYWDRDWRQEPLIQAVRKPVRRGDLAVGMRCGPVMLTALRRRKP